MQLVEYVSKTSVFNVNSLLEEGYIVISVTPVSAHVGGNGSYGEWGAYFVLEKVEG